jgi:hypothetical protein
MCKASSEAIQPPNNQCVTLPQGLQACFELRAICVFSTSFFEQWTSPNLISCSRGRTDPSRRRLHGAVTACYRRRRIGCWTSRAQIRLRQTLEAELPVTGTNTGRFVGVAKLPYELFHTLREFYLALPDGVSMYPAHGHGSPCGADIGDRMESTIGYEREFNPFLRFSDFEKSKQHVLSNAPPVPKYYPLMKKLNAHGPKVLGNLPHIAGLPPKAFKHAVEEKAGVL